MSLENKSELGLQFEEVKVNFIFSFFIDKESSIKSFVSRMNSEKIGLFKNVESNVIKENSFDTDSLKKLMCSYTLSDESYNKSKKTTKEFKQEYDNQLIFKARKDGNSHYDRQVILPNLRLKKHEYFTKLDFGNVTIKLPILRKYRKKEKTEYYNDELYKGRCKLNGLVRISDSGIGAMTLTFHLKKQSKKHLTSDDIFQFYNLLNASDSQDSKKYIYPKITCSKNPFDKKEEKFESRRLINILTQLFGKLKDEKSIITFGCENSCVKNSECENSLLFHHKDLDCQNPYVVVNGKLMKNDIKLNYENELQFNGHPLCWWDHFDGKHFERLEDDDQKKVKRNLRETILLLLRYIIGGELLSIKNDEEFNRLVPLPFFREKINHYTKNYSYFKHIYIASHHRTTVLFHENVSEEINAVSLSKVENVPNFVSDSILDLFEVIRMRWHFSVVLNELLDIEIDKLSDIPAARNKEFAKNILSLRKKYAYFLSDPLTYSYGGTLVNDLLESAKDSFQIDYLNKLIETKFTVIDDVINDLMRTSIL